MISFANPSSRCGARVIGYAASIAIIAIAPLFSGCRSAKVSDVTPASNQSGVSIARPDFVYVGNFDLGSTAFQQDQGLRPLALLHHKDSAQEIAELQDLLEADIVSDLNQQGMPAGRLSDAATRPTHGWLVGGEFLELKEGNRVARAVIGFGQGESSAKLYVTLADLAHPEGQNLLNFNSDTSGDKTPGGSVVAVAAHTPWGMVAKYAIDKNPSKKDMKELAKAIADQIIKFASGGTANKAE